MTNSNPPTHIVGLSPKHASILAGAGLLLMTLCAPFSYFYFFAQCDVSDPDFLVCLQNKSDGYLFGMLLLFITFVMDLVVAWALFWYFRAKQPALSQLVAWARLVYTMLAFAGLAEHVKLYELANTSRVFGPGVLEETVKIQALNAGSLESFALFFFGFHLVLLGALIWRSLHVPKWISILVTLAGISYIVNYVLGHLSLGAGLEWIALFALGELIFMLWLLILGWKRKVVARAT